MLFSKPQRHGLTQSFLKPSIVRNQDFIKDYPRKMQHMEAPQRFSEIFSMQ